MGDSWDKKPEDWAEEMRTVDAEAKKPEGAENESDKCELLLTGRLQTEITNGENCLEGESVEYRIRSINLHAPIIWTTFCKVDSKALLNMSVFSGDPIELTTCMTTLSRLCHGVFQGLELNVNDLQARIDSLRQECSTKLFKFQGSLGSERLQ